MTRNPRTARTAPQVATIEDQSPPPTANNSGEEARRVFGREIAGLPVPIWGAIVSCTCMVVGWHWDISWHRSIGRDTVWTLPHISIYVSLALAFLYNAGLVLRRTFGPAQGAGGLRVLGFVGPSGAFFTLWGILMQFSAILFDNWWHNVYGLDVNVFSPPHGLLGWGINGFFLGQVILIVLYRNLSGPAQEKKTRWVLILIWSLFIDFFTVTVDPGFGPMGVRSYAFVISSTLAFPFALVLLQGYLDWPWASTAAAAGYMLTIVLLMQIFQLFPATPGFGPVFHHLDTFLPPTFPLMLVVPALAMSLVLWRKPAGGALPRFILAGGVFVLVFNVTNWLTSAFLMTDWAHNRFFAGGFPSQAFEQEYRQAAPMVLGIASVLTVAAAIVGASWSSWLGLWFGRWLRGMVR